MAIVRTIGTFLFRYGVYIIWGIRFIYGLLTQKFTGVVNMALYDTLKEQVTLLVAEYKVIAADKKLTMTELWTLLQHASLSLIKVAEQVGGTGPEKKAAVLAALDKFYDEVIAPLDIPYVPNIVEPSVDNFVKKIALQMADGGIDAFVKFMNDNNLFSKE